MANTAHSFGKYRDEYVRFISTLQIKPQWKPSIERIAKTLYQHKDRYMEVEETSGVPWKVIAVIHQLECGARFDLHLHNGDPLTGKTRRVPRGYPKAPPANGNVYTWEESAQDALVNRMKMNQVTDWSEEGIAFQLEKYNGFGYRRFNVPSPYLWSGSQHYNRGKFVADGKWDSSHVSQQAGAMLLYVQLRDLEAADRVPEPTPEDTGEVGKGPAVEKPAEKPSGGIIHEVRDFFRWVFGAVSAWFTAESFGFTKEILEWGKEFFSNRAVLMLLAAGAAWLIFEYIERRKK